MVERIQCIGFVSPEFLGDQGGLQTVIFPLLMEHETVQFVFQASTAKATYFPVHVGASTPRSGHVIITNSRLVWMSGTCYGETHVVKSIPWRVINCWDTLSLITNGTHGFSLHVDASHVEAERGNLLFLLASRDKGNVARVSQIVATKVCKFSY